MRHRRVGAILASLSLTALLAATLIRIYAVPAPRSWFMSDQQAYLSLARQPFVQTPAVYPPATWRVLPPLVARGIAEVVGGGPERGFLVLTFGCYALMPLLAFAWLGALGVSVDVALWCAAVVAITPTVMGYTAWDVVRVDPLSCLLLFIGAYAVVRTRRVLLLFVVAALACTKETVLIAALFGVAWGILVDRRILLTSLASLALAVLIRRVVLQTWLMPVAAPFDSLREFKEVIRYELTLRYAARRLLLASGTTWNVMLPLVAIWLVDERRNPRAQALAVAILVATAQILFASDTQRVVAAAYPFVIASCALQIEVFDRWQRTLAGVMLVAAQVPWLLENGRIVHLPWLRGVEIGVVIVTGALVAWRFTRSASRPQPAPA